MYVCTKYECAYEQEQAEIMNSFDVLVKFLLALLSISPTYPQIGTFAAPVTATHGHWKLIARAGWSARPPKERKTFVGPAPFVIIHHSYKPGVAQTTNDCRVAMQQMQDSHMDERHWADIGYSFAVCGDGNVYEGRGYEVVAAHAPLYNNRSIGLLLIGDFTDQLPPAPMMKVAQNFIKYSLEAGHLLEDYILYGHRQVRNGTVCPGDALYAEIQNWPHWQNDVEVKAYPPVYVPARVDVVVTEKP